MDNNTQLQSFTDDKSYQHALSVATKMAEAEIIPEAYRKKPANILIALDMANRAGVSVMTIMQNMYVVKGKPSFSGAYVIAGINSCGIYDRLKYRVSGKGDTLSCIAYAVDKSTGQVDEGPEVTMEMAKAEGWYNSNPKWKNMPELMIRYRAAAFFGRVYTPDVMMGMHMVEEIEDIPSSRYEVIEPDKDSKILERALSLIEDCTTIEDLVKIKAKIDTSAWSPEDAQTFMDAGKEKQISLTPKPKADDNKEGVDIAG